MTTEQRMTAIQLAEYLGLPDVRAVWRLVNEEQLPWHYYGKGKPALHRRGQRQLFRFLVSEVDRWDADRRKAFLKPEEEAAAIVAPDEVKKFHDGKIRGGRRTGPRKPRARAGS